MADVTITRKNIDGSRYYIVDGVPMRSVTTVLNVIAKPALIPWAVRETVAEVESSLRPYVGKKLTRDALDAAVSRAAKASDFTRDSAADYGTRVHDAVSLWLKSGRKSPLPKDDTGPAVEFFRDWLKREGIEPVMSEQIIFSTEFKLYGGQVDLFGYRPKTKTHVVIDWKSSGGIYPEQILQAAAYAKGLEERLGSPVTEAWIVRARFRDGEFSTGEYCVKGEELEQAFTGFMAAKTLDDTLRALAQDMKQNL